MPEAPVTPEPVVVEPVTPVAPQVEAKPAPPWGTPEEFNPEKAWDLITNLREQKNDPAAAKELSELREFKVKAEDANRTEIEKVQARADAAEKALAVREAEALRASIALEKGLTAAQSKRLVGATREELEADAVALLADFPTATIPVAPGATGQGNVGTPIGGPSDPIAALDAQIADATKAANFQLVIALKEQRAAAAAAKN